MQRSRKLAFASLTVAAALVAALVVAEIGLRFGYDRIEQITGVAEWRTGSYEEITYYWDQYHPRLGWSNRPDYRSDERVPFRVSINSRGLRGEREYTAAPADGITRVALLGDSTAFGEEVDDEQTVAVHLESKLPRSEVLNFGVHGYGAGQMLLRLEDEVFDYAPDLIVVLYLTFDVFRDTSPAFVHPKPLFGLEDGRLVVRNVPVPEAKRQPWWARHSFLAARLWGRPAVLPDGRDEDHQALLAAILGRMQQAAHDHGVPIVFVHIADRNTLDAVRRDDDFRRSLEAIRQVVAEAGDETIDLTETLAEALRLDREGWTKPHGHWSELGNERIAQLIAGRLVRRGLVGREADTR